MWANAQRDGRPAECRWRPLKSLTFWRYTNQIIIIIIIIIQRRSLADAHY